MRSHLFFLDAQGNIHPDSPRAEAIVCPWVIVWDVCNVRNERKAALFPLTARKALGGHSFSGHSASQKLAIRGSVLALAAAFFWAVSCPPPALAQGAASMTNDGAVTRGVRLLFPQHQAPAWAPKKLSIYGKKVGLVMGNDTCPELPGVVYCYDHTTGQARVLATDALPFRGDATVLHYKKGGIGINDRYLAYCAGNSNGCLVRLADGHRFTVAVHDRRCVNVSANNLDRNGFGFNFIKKTGTDFCGQFWVDIYYVSCDDRGNITNNLVHASYKNLLDYYGDPNPWLYDRGPQLGGDGLIAWLFGGHDDRDTTIKYRRSGSREVLTIDGRLYEKQGLQRPVLFSAHGNFFFSYHYTDTGVRPEAAPFSGGLSVYDLRTRNLFRLRDSSGQPLMGAHPALCNDVGLYSRGDIIYRIKIDPQASHDPIPLVRSRDGRAPSHIQLGQDGLFVFLACRGEDTPDNKAYLSSIWRSDANLDGQVNQADFNIFAASLAAPAGTDLRGDFNSDGRVDRADWDLLNEEWGALGTQVRAPGNGQAPPFPATGG